MRFRTALWPAGLRLPLMRIMIRRLSDNSTLILRPRSRVGQLGQWGRETKGPRSTSPLLSSVSEGHGHPPGLLQSGRVLPGWIKHPLTPLWGRMKVGARNKTPNNNNKNSANSILSAVDIKDRALAGPEMYKPQWHYCLILI